MKIFVKVQYLYKQLQTVIILGCNPWDIITIVIALNILYNNFDLITANLIKTGDKSIEQIQSILQLKKAKNINKQFMEAVAEIAMAFRDN